MATIPTPEQGKPILDFSTGTFDGNSNLFQSRNGATEHVNGNDVADYVNTSRIYNGLETESKTPVGAINEVNSGLADKMDTVNPTGSGSFSLNRKAGTTTGTNSFAEGYDTTASGNSSHAEGYSTTASGDFSHTEGSGTTASGSRSHAEGYGAIASAYYCHAEGSGTTASGMISHAEGNGTTANHKSQHVFGEYNVLDDSTATANERGNYVEIVGNGISNNSRSNARTLDWSGNEVLSGTIEATGFGATLKQAVINEITPTDNPLFYLGTYTYTVASVAANRSITISKANFGITDIDGYTPISMPRIGVSKAGFVLTTFNATGVNTVLGVMNNTSDAIENTTFTIAIIYVKSNFLQELT